MYMVPLNHGSPAWEEEITQEEEEFERIRTTICGDIETDPYD